jgi:Tfp pilus assembly protein PilO
MNPFDLDQLRAAIRRYLFCAVCSALSLVLAAALWVLRQNVVGLEKSNRETSQEFAAMLATLKAGPLVRQELARAQDSVARIEGNLVVEKNLAENLWYFYKIHPDSKEILTSLRPLNAQPATDGSDYKLVPFSLQLTGTYEQIASYLLELETGPRLAVIKAFSFRRQQLGQPALALNLEVRLLGKK